MDYVNAYEDTMVKLGKIRSSLRCIRYLLTENINYPKLSHLASNIEKELSDFLKSYKKHFLTNSHKQESTFINDKNSILLASFGCGQISKRIAKHDLILQLFPENAHKNVVKLYDTLMTISDTFFSIPSTF